MRINLHKESHEEPLEDWTDSQGSPNPAQHNQIQALLEKIDRKLSDGSDDKRWRFPQRLADQVFVRRIRLVAGLSTTMGIGALALALVWAVTSSPRSTVVVADAEGNTVSLSKFNWRNLLVTDGMVGNFCSDWYTGFQTLRPGTYRSDTQRLATWLDDGIRAQWFNERNAKDKHGRTIEQQLLSAQVTSSFVVTQVNLKRDDTTGTYSCEISGIQKLFVGNGQVARAKNELRDRLLIEKPFYNHSNIANPYGLRIREIVKVPMT